MIRMKASSEPIVSRKLSKVSCLIIVTIQVNWAIPFCVPYVPTKPNYSCASDKKRL